MKTTKKRSSKEPDVSPLEVPKLIALYEACVQNAQDLLDEAYLLARHAKFARATFLAITALEEMGKAQLVADYADNCSSADEFKEAFGSHRIKVAYTMREASLKTEISPSGAERVTNATIIYDGRQATYQVELRQQALYVDYGETYDNLLLPSRITKEEFDYVLERVQDAFDEVEHAEWLNGRIGSKGLFK